MDKKDLKDLIVIGGGAGGLSITSAAAQLGLSVTLIEKQKRLGGDCLHYGCVPSKTLIHAAKVAHLMRSGSHYGLTDVEPEIDLAKVNAHVQSVIDTIQKHDDPDRFRSYGAEVLFGKAQFIDSHTIKIGDETRSAKKIIIASGSRPAIPPIPGLADLDILTNETIFQLKKLPTHLIILGAGPIGIELAQAMQRLGSQVTVIEMMSRILPPVDAEAANILHEVLQKEGIQLLVDTKVMQVSKEDNNFIVETEHNGKKLEFSGDALLVATGRQANLDLALEKAGVEHSPRGIKVDKKLRTSQKHIFAVGDVTDNPMKFTHLAEHHAGIVISNAIFHFPKKVNDRVIPSVVYTDPECAMVGLQEEEAQQQKITYEVSKIDFKEIDRAQAEVETTGFCKIILVKGKLKGAVCVGPQAGELIAELALAIQAKLSLRQIADTIHAYPTLAQMNRRVVTNYFAPKLFSERTRKVLRFIRGLLG